MKLKATPVLITAVALTYGLVAGSHGGSVVARVFPPGSFAIDGFPVNCGGVVTIVTPDIPDIAMARPGQILLHPVLGNYPTGVKLFVYAHECAHHFVGANEVAADQWAIKLGRNQGWISVQTVQEVCQAFWFSPGDWTPFPGQRDVKS